MPIVVRREGDSAFDMSIDSVAIARLARSSTDAPSARSQAGLCSLIRDMTLESSSHRGNDAGTWGFFDHASLHHWATKVPQG